jgi:hypothetical protein
MSGLLFVKSSSSRKSSAESADPGFVETVNLPSGSFEIVVGPMP